MAGNLVSSLEADFKPSKYKDTYRAAVQKLIERKAKGEEIEAPKEEEPEDDSGDLLKALEASVKSGSGSGKKKR
jgi:DNA end-binding protein Ku